MGNINISKKNEDINVKKHSSILTLIVIVCGGILYSMYSSNSLFPRKPVRLDSMMFMLINQ